MVKLKKMKKIFFSRNRFVSRKNLFFLETGFVNFTTSKKSDYTKIFNREIEYLISITKFAFTFLFISVLLMASIAYQKTYAQTTDLHKTPFSWEIKPGDVDLEFLREWDYNLNPPAQLQESLEQKQVRIIYLVPSDKSIRNDYKAAINDAIVNVQDFYKREMGNDVTFSLHSPIVEVYQTIHSASWYSTNRSSPNSAQTFWFYQNTLADGFSLTGGRSNDPNNRWIYYIDADIACGQLIGGGSGFAILSANDFRGLVSEQNIPACAGQQPDYGGRSRWIGGLGHELGHAFDLPHPPGCGASGANQGCAGGAFAQNSLMWVGYARYPNTYFLPEDKQILLNSGFFSQAGCTFSVVRTDVGVPEISATGGNISFSVTTQNNCAWSATSNASWITTASSSSGNGSGTVTFNIAANTGTSRTGAVTIAGQTFNLFQQNGMQTCTYSLLGVSEYPVSGGNGGVGVNTQSGCSWTAMSTASWITVTSNSSGSGNGTVTFYVAPNTVSNYRTGSITVSGQSFTVIQSGGTARRALFDFDGDGKTDYAVGGFARGFSTMQEKYWYILMNGTNEFRAMQWGRLGDREVPADYDGDGKTDVAVYRDGTWYLLRSQAGFTGVAFGAASDISMPADFDGDGKAELAVFRPSNGVWYIYNLTNSQFSAVQFGQNEDKPVAADYDGDGKADIAVYRPSNGTWYLLRSQLGFSGAAFGISTDKPVVADYDGDNKTDIAVARQSGGITTWYILGSMQGFYGVQFGADTDKLVPGDYDGDGKTDVAVWRLSNGVFYVSRSQQGFTAIGFGQNGDSPLASVYVR